jgi:hypothetical protein
MMNGAHAPRGRAVPVRNLRNLRRRVEQQEERIAAETENRKRAEDLKDQAKVATRDTYTWVTQYAKTYNEHWIEEGRPDPYEHFPAYPYLEDTFILLDLERVIWFEKSRDMMLSWACVAYLTFQAMTVPFRGVLLQTQKADKVVQLIDYAKCLYRTQPPWLQDVFKLSKSIQKQGALELEFANGSYVAGVPGGADQIRSYHPWGYLNDESSFQPEAGECYNEALSAVKGKIIFNSSAGPGWYADARRDIVRNEEE